jgi:multisubunit Na+/H+ antiporter MnhB subunit
LLGSFYDVYNIHGFLSTLIVYQVSVIYGGMGHSYLWPYMGIIGCSPGVYGLMGGCWVVVLFRREHIPAFIGIVMTVMLALQVVWDCCSFLFMYSPDVSYTSHVFGYVTGILLSLALLLLEWRSECRRKRVAGALGLLGFGLLTAFLCYHYTRRGQPQSSVQGFFRNQQTKSNCCVSMYNYAQESGLSTQEAQDHGYCYEGEFHYQYSYANI